MARYFEIAGGRPIAAIREEIEKYEAENARIDAKVSFVVKLVIIAFVSTFAGIPVVIFTDFLFVGIAMTAGGFVSVFALTFGVLMFGTDENWEITRTLQLKRLLSVIGRDVSAGQSVDFTFDGRGCTHVNKAVGEWKGHSTLPRDGVVNYEDPWLNITFKTADGSSLTIVAEERAKEKRRPKRKGRIRKKVRSVHRFRVRISLSPRSWAGVKKSFDGLGGTEVEGLQVVRVTRDGHRIDCRAVYRGEEEPDKSILRLLALLYAHFQPYLSAKRRKKIRAARAA